MSILSHPDIPSTLNGADAAGAPPIPPPAPTIPLRPYQEDALTRGEASDLIAQVFARRAA